MIVTLRGAASRSRRSISSQLAFQPLHSGIFRLRRDLWDDRPSFNVFSVSVGPNVLVRAAIELLRFTRLPVGVFLQVLSNS